MPRYFMDIVRNGNVHKDHEAHELEDHHHAHREAVQMIAEMAAGEIPKDGQLNLTVAVTDETHRVLFKTHVTFEPGVP